MTAGLETGSSTNRLRRDIDGTYPHRCSLPPSRRSPYLEDIERE
jgi:hypothetical protein